MSEASIVQAEKREGSGTAHVRRLRRQGVLPAVVYSGGAPGTLIQLREHDFEREIRRHASENVMMDVSIDGTPKKILVKEVQHHPVSGRILHVDFQEVSLTDTLHVVVPVELTGEAIGVTQFGGVLEQVVREVEISCLPSDIPNAIQVDVTDLGIGQTLNVKDLPIDAQKIEVLTDPTFAVVHVSEPRVVEETDEEAEEAAVASGQEPEVITEKKDEDASDE